MNKDFENGVKNFKLRTISVVSALALGVVGYFLVKPSTAYATVNDFYTVQNEETGEDELWYKVQKGDNASKISTFAVSYFTKKGEVPDADRKMFKEEPSSRASFWPGLVKKWLDYQNDERAAAAVAEGKNSFIRVVKFSIHPGDRIKVANTYLELIFDNAEAKASPWFAQYLKENNIYSKKQIIYIDLEDTKKRIEEVYRVTDPNHKHVVTDEDALAYLKGISGPNVQFKIKEGAELDPKKDEVWQFYELLLSPEEVEKYKNNGGKSSSIIVIEPTNEFSSEDLTPEETHKILKRVHNKRA